MELPAFTLHRPSSVDEALALASAHRGAFDWLAGGTDLLPNYKCRINAQPHVIALWEIDELKACSPTWIGAGVRLSDLETDEEIGQRFPGLREAVQQVASPLLRRSGTLGGNIMLDTRCDILNQSTFWRAAAGHCLKAEGNDCQVVPGKKLCVATYSGDIAPVLMALGARFVVAGPSGRRSYSGGEFFHDDGLKPHIMEPGDLLLGVELPDEASNISVAYEKLRMRGSIDFPSLGIAAGIRLADDGTLAYLSVVATALLSCPIEFEDICSSRLGLPFAEEQAGKLAMEVMLACKAYNNVPLSPRYRKAMVEVFTRRALLRALGAAGSPA